MRVPTTHTPAPAVSLCLPAGHAQLLLQESRSTSSFKSLAPVPAPWVFISVTEGGHAVALERNSYRADSGRLRFRSERAKMEKKRCRNTSQCQRPGVILRVVQREVSVPVTLGHPEDRDQLHLLRIKKSFLATGAGRGHRKRWRDLLPAALKMKCAFCNISGHSDSPFLGFT